jgi:hypothetical protein
MSGAARSRNAGLIWADLLDTASLNARPIARYVAFMFVAGVIACYGVIDDNVILIVGPCRSPLISCRSRRSASASSTGGRRSPRGRS